MIQNRCWARYFNRTRCWGKRGHCGRHWVRDRYGNKMFWDNASEMMRKQRGFVDQTQQLPY